MTLEEFEAKPAIEHLRLMVQNFNLCNEDFNQQFTLAQLSAIHRAWMLSEWDIFPTEWNERQLQEALAGHAPRWSEDDGTPIYNERRA